MGWLCFYWDQLEGSTEPEAGQEMEHPGKGELRWWDEKV